MTTGVRAVSPSLVVSVVVVVSVTGLVGRVSGEVSITGGDCIVGSNVVCSAIVLTVGRVSAVVSVIGTVTVSSNVTMTGGSCVVAGTVESSSVVISGVDVLASVVFCTVVNSSVTTGIYNKIGYYQITAYFIIL